VDNGPLTCISAWKSVQLVMICALTVNRLKHTYFAAVMILSDHNLGYTHIDLAIIFPCTVVLAIVL